MSRRRPPLRRSALALVLAACPGRVGPEEQAPQAARLAAKPAAAAPETLDLPASSTGPVPAQLPVSPPSPAPVPAATGPLAATATAAGALVVWADFDARSDRSDIKIAALDARGFAAGPPRLLRRTTGEVLDLAISHHDGDAWIAWQAELAAEPPRLLLAAVAVAADLSSVAAPVTLHQYQPSDATLAAEVRVLARPAGDAIVAASGPDAKCTDIVDGRRTRCPGFDLFHLRRGGRFTRAAHFGADGGDPGLGAVVDVGPGAVVDVWAWHGGPTFASVYAPHGEPAARPPFRLLECRPPIRRGFTGSALVTLCPADYARDGERCFVDGVPADDGSCDRVHAAGLDGQALTPDRGAPLHARQARCDGGRPVLDLVVEGGRLRLDPHLPGASFELSRELGLWTGEYALFITADGAVARRRCTGDGRFVATEPAPPLALAAPARPIEHAPSDMSSRIEPEVSG